MKNKIWISICLLIFLLSCGHSNRPNDSLNYNVHTFYYNWYGSLNRDGKYNHWRHDILPHWSDTTWDNAGTFPGKEDIGANFYPELGCYSSNDPMIIEQHMEMMSQAGIGVFVISWWGKDSYEDQSIATYLNLAEEYNLKVAFHIEPFYNSAEEFYKQIDYLSTHYSKHSAIYLHRNKPLYYVYDSYKLTIEDWQKLLSPSGEKSIRNTRLDGVFIGLWVNENEEDFFLKSGFDGFYTYFASDGFVYGSTYANWARLSTFAKSNQLIFIPCAGPGYKDTRIRPWNSSNTKARDSGRYYENMLNAAIKVNPEYIGITSFNEWHEGTQIEPAIPYSIDGYTYDDYGVTTDPWFYIKKTKELLNKYIPKTTSDKKN